MTLQRFEHQGAAPPTVLNGDITAASTQVTLLAPTGYPTGSIGPFVIVIDKGNSNEEKILCSSRSGPSCLVAPGGRGYDMTVASGHTGPSPIQHVFAAVEADDDNDHIYNTTRDDHTQYLNPVRHDTTPRHVFGAAFTIPPAPTTSAVGDIAAQGGGAGPARSDHLHGRESFGVGLVQAVGIGNVTVDGLSTTPARADHIHNLTNNPSFATVAATTVTATTVNATTVTAPNVLTICTSSTRPASPAAGAMIYETDTGNFKIWTTATTLWQAPWNTAWGQIGYATTAVNQAGVTAVVDLTSLSVAVTVPANRILKVTSHVLLNKDATAGLTRLYINEGATNLSTAFVYFTLSTFITLTEAVQLTPTVGAHTYKLRLSADTGAVTAANATQAGFILVEDMGPNGAPA